MLLTQGSGWTSGSRWAMIEVTDESRIEEIVLHIIRWVRKNLEGEPFQLLFPVKNRQIGGVTMDSPYLFMRTKDLHDLENLRGIYGVQGLVKDGKGELVTLSQRWMNKLIARVKGNARDWYCGIRQGSFVRVIYGPQRMLCGEVIKLHRNGMAEVRVGLKVRELRLKAPVKALFNMDHVPKGERNYYYNGE